MSDHFAVNATGAQVGDEAAFRAPKIVVPVVSCLVFSLYLSEDVSLDIHKEFSPGSLDDEYVCTIIGEEYPRWQSIHMDLSIGAYYLTFATVVRSEFDEIRIDNVTLFPQRCSVKFPAG